MAEKKTARRPATLALKGNPAQIKEAQEALERAGLKLQEGEPLTVETPAGFACPVCGNGKDFSFVSTGVRCDNCRSTLLIHSAIPDHWRR